MCGRNFFGETLFLNWSSLFDDHNFYANMRTRQESYQSVTFESVPYSLRIECIINIETVLIKILSLKGIWTVSSYIRFIFTDFVVILSCSLYLFLELMKITEQKYLRHVYHFIQSLRKRNNNCRYCLLILQKSI